MLIRNDSNTDSNNHHNNDNSNDNHNVNDDTSIIHDNTDRGLGVLAFVLVAGVFPFDAGVAGLKQADVINLTVTLRYVCVYYYYYSLQ